ncbi:macro domain-containing protein [Actinacidiphila glaucinigra]|uniref:macro domain-containing protein n=1 Tax=Actinacidiphila glaucinigra TaxID=235986 RepID=UPI0037B3D487
MATPAFGLGPRVGRVIHTVGPVGECGDQGEAEVLGSCYRRCLEVRPGPHSSWASGQTERRRTVRATSSGRQETTISASGSRTAVRPRRKIRVCVRTEHC